jgi:HSP20 family protein
MSMLLRFDPFRELDRVFQKTEQLTRTAMPMDAYRHGETFVVHFDLPGVDPASIDLEVERNVLTISAERSWRPVDGDEVVAAERTHGSFRRQLLIGDGLDTERMHASYEHGVLTLTIPVAEKSKPRKFNVTTASDKESIGQAGSTGNQEAIEANAS